MKVTPEEVEQRMRHFKEKLKQAGVKMTHQRLEIFKEVAKSGNHPDAETIFKGLHEKLPTVTKGRVSTGLLEHRQARCGR